METFANLIKEQPELIAALSKLILSEGMRKTFSDGNGIIGFYIDTGRDYRTAEVKTVTWELTHPNDHQVAIDAVINSHYSEGWRIEHEGLYQEYNDPEDVKQGYTWYKQIRFIRFPKATG